ncbi:ABC transporter permease [Eubacterium multiforme]|uniref:ABC-2 type transport system permease protein n=1 Tax=Eubacterium multiforme TaxID=83339 RepID=A0ABT9URM4_9FIRM|nr:ABC transporter permease [Eubacterium multiforme]MDQ0148605.1 ABC-2 type transport system permease protein [Eubacterium multiforme]
MRNILVMVKNNLKIMILKKPIYFLGIIIVPVLILVGLTPLMARHSEEILIGVSNLDKSKSADIIVNSLKSQDNFKVLNIEENDIKGSIQEKKIECGVIIKSGFQKDIINGKEKNNIEIIGKEGDSIYKSIKSIIELDLNNIRDLGKISNGNIKKYNILLKEYSKNTIKIDKGTLRSDSKDYNISGMFVGFLVMFMFFRALFGAGKIMDDKKCRVYTRIFTAPIKTYEYYLGNVLASLISIVLQIILTLIGVYLFTNVNFGMSYIQLFFVLLLISIFAVSLGTFCISVSKTDQEVSILSNILIMILVMLGGCFVPVYIFPSALDKISKLLPTRWAMDMIFSLQDGMSIGSLYRNIIIILLYSLALFLGAAYITKIKDKRFNDI